MAGLPTVGGGRQLGDGNLNELVIGTMPDPQTATATATLTVAQVTGGMLVFDLVIVNLGTSSGALTLTMGTGLTLSGSGTVAITSSAQLRFRRTGTNDTASFTVYRIS